MKKVFSLILAIALVVAFTAFTAEAKIFHQCHCCGGDGIYTCDAKDCKDGRLPCGRCNGTGVTSEKCADCNGTGKCRMCDGTGKRAGDETITCDNCKGTGKCQGGPGRGACTGGYYVSKCPDCNGEKFVWHNSEWCIYARKHGGKCPICKGTGYEGDGVEGTPNDGFSNVPHAGDGIYYLDGSYAVYGGSGGSSGAKPSGTDTSTEPKNGNTNASNELLPQDRHMTIYLGTASVDSDDSAGKTAIGVITYQKMTDGQKNVYDGMPDGELDGLLVSVSNIISTVKVGEISAESQDAANAFCQANGINNLSDANILPVSFEGHIEIGFPIMVSVEVNPDFFDGSKPMHVFHIKEGGVIVQIPDEDVVWVTREEDGRVARVEFYTDSFSDFLLSDVEGLVLPADDIQPKSDSGSAVTYSGDNSSSGTVVILAVIAGFLLILTVTLRVFAFKKRKTSDSFDALQETLDSNCTEND